MYWRSNQIICSVIEFCGNMLSKWLWDFYWSGLLGSLSAKKGLASRNFTTSLVSFNLGFWALGNCTFCFDCCWSWMCLCGGRVVKCRAPIESQESQLSSCKLGVHFRERRADSQAIEFLPGPNTISKISLKVSRSSFGPFLFSKPVDPNVH